MRESRFVPIWEGVEIAVKRALAIVLVAALLLGFIAMTVSVASACVI